MLETNNHIPEEYQKQKNIKHFKEVNVDGPIMSNDGKQIGVVYNDKISSTDLNVLLLTTGSVLG